MTRIVDRGAVTAAFVGIGMAVTIAISFLLVIPIEPVYWLLALPAGLLIGYYANQRSGWRRGFGRLFANAAFAGLATGLTFAVLLLAIKALFFFADNGYRDPGQGGPITCQGGADCVYRRYLADGRGAELEAAGVTDAQTFAGSYWSQQLTTGAALLAVTTIGALVGGALFAMTQRRSGSGAPKTTKATVQPPNSPPVGVRGETLAERVRAFRSIGFFAGDPRGDDEIAAVVDDLYAAAFGAPLPRDGEAAELGVAAHDATRVWWQDIEADVDQENAVYEATLREWSAISVGAFRPESITERWATERGPITVDVTLDGRMHTLRPAYQDDWIDLGIVPQLNQVIRASGRQFEVVAAFDQTAVILALTPGEKARLMRERGWRFAGS